MRLDRRDMLHGAFYLAAAATAEILVPRRAESKLGTQQLERVIPLVCGNWRAHSEPEDTAPERDDSLAHTIYDQVLVRHYRDAAENVITLLCAHGPRQTDTLQLHRPDECYPAFGFQLGPMSRETITRAGMNPLRLIHVAATTAQRHEQIAYWTRIGDELPTSAVTQRLAIIRAAIAGTHVDGLLMRVSNALPDAIAARALNSGFVRALLAAIPAQYLPILLGSRVGRGPNA